MWGIGTPPSWLSVPPQGCSHDSGMALWEEKGGGVWSAGLWWWPCWVVGFGARMGFGVQGCADGHAGL